MGIFEPKQEKSEEKESYKPKLQTRQNSKKGIVSSFTGKDKKEWIIVNVDNNGERVKYNQKDHGDLKIGDTIVIN